MKNLGLKITGGVLFAVMAASFYSDVRRRKQDKLAGMLLREISLIINPATKGLLNSDAFDIAYLPKLQQEITGQIITLKASAATRVANVIDDAWSFWGDDEDQVYGAFRSLSDQVQVSQVAAAYQRLFGVNLIDKLYDKMDDAEVGIILEIVNTLPPYRKLI